MIYITRNPNNLSLGTKITNEEIRSPELVCEITIDGEELKAMRNRFYNLPQLLSADSVTWYGDHAKFIARNL